LVNELHQRINHLREYAFDFCVKQFLMWLNLPHNRTLYYQGPVPLETEGLTLKKISLLETKRNLTCIFYPTGLVKRHLNKHMPIDKIWWYEFKPEIPCKIIHMLSN
jgi:hypothetical protein